MDKEKKIEIKIGGAAPEEKPIETPEPPTEGNKDVIGDLPKADAQQKKTESSATATQEEQIPVSEVNKLLKAMEEKFMRQAEQVFSKRLAEAMSRQGFAMQSPASHTPPVVFSEREIDRDDVLDEPAIFFTFSHYYAIYSYMKNGIEVKTPYGRPIEFKSYHRYKRPSKQGLGEESVSIGRVMVYSKKEAEWIRNCPFFENIIIEDVSKVVNMDVTLAEAMSRASLMVTNLDDHQVIRRAQNHPEIRITADISEVRRALIEFIAKEELQRQAERRKHEVVEIAEARKMAETVKAGNVGA